MLSVNKAILVGAVADKPVIRDIKGGRKMVGLSVFTARRWLKAGSDEQASKEWHRIVIVNPDLAAYAEAHLAKDDQIYVEGELHTMFWRDETFDWQSLTRIILWQEGHQIKRVSESDCLEATGELDLLKAAQETRLFDTLGHVA